MIVVRDSEKKSGFVQPKTVLYGRFGLVNFPQMGRSWTKTLWEVQEHRLSRNRLKTLGKMGGFRKKRGSGGKAEGLSLAL